MANAQRVRAPASGSSPTPLGWPTVLLLATAGAIAVANVYYLQPLLELIAEDFRVDPHEAGLVSVGMQTGYALGILAFVPLGDMLERRRLLVVMFFAVSALLAVATFAPSIPFLALTMLAIGICTTCPQVLLPFSADLAAPAQRGRVIGTMQTGLILGTLFARVAGGFIGAHFGWRAVFGCAAVVMVCSGFALARVLPARAPNVTLSYGALLRSIFSLIGRHPPLRVSMLLGGLSFSTFAGVWTVFAFHMHDLGFGSDIVGSIGLLSFLTALAAGTIGVIADRLGTLFTGVIGWVLLVLTFALYLTCGWSLWGMILASAIFPFATQLTQISNQVRIFSLDDAARSRLNTAYTFSMFGGGALGALGANLAWQWNNWTGVCAFELLIAASMAPVLAWYASIRRAEQRRAGTTI